MLLCPKCKSEYQNGLKVCSDCKCELIEKPEIVEEVTFNKVGLTIFSFIVGVLFILCSPMLSYKLTTIYFIPNGNGQYITEQFNWMLNAYHNSFLFVGGIICVPCILFWYKNYKSN
jgi:hypothetical protein